MLEFIYRSTASTGERSSVSLFMLVCQFLSSSVFTLFIIIIKLFIVVFISVECV
ncbi:hypothetical protein PO909_028375 [Leuciscus waleckii]